MNVSKRLEYFFDYVSPYSYLADSQVPALVERTGAELVYRPFFLGGVMPIPTWKGAIVSYVVLTATITVVCLVIYGWPTPAEWADTWLPALLGPAILIGGYMIVARLGHWRIERQLDRLNR